MVVHIPNEFMTSHDFPGILHHMISKVSRAKQSGFSRVLFSCQDLDSSCGLILVLLYGHASISSDGQQIFNHSFRTFQTSTVDSPIKRRDWLSANGDVEQFSCPLVSWCNRYCLSQCTSWIGVDGFHDLGSTKVFRLWGIKETNATSLRTLARPFQIQVNSGCHLSACLFPCLKILTILTRYPYEMIVCVCVNALCGTLVGTSTERLMLHTSQLTPRKKTIWTLILQAWKSSSVCSSGLVCLSSVGIVILSSCFPCLLVVKFKPKDAWFCSKRHGRVSYIYL